MPGFFFVQKNAAQKNYPVTTDRVNLGRPQIYAN